MEKASSLREEEKDFVERELSRLMEFTLKLEDDVNSIVSYE